MKTYIILHKFDVICLSETILDSTIPNDDDKLQIPGYTLIRSDHLSNTKRGGVFIYYKSSLPLRVINTGYLPECLSFELQIGDKICNLVAFYRSPSQSQDDFETFADNFETTLELLAQKNPFLLTAIGDFNAKSSNWYNKEKTSFEGNTIENVTSQLGLHQMINEPTHILPNSSSCIDLIFTSQPNMVIESGIHSSLPSSCHHQIVFAKFNLKICYPTPYSREVWHFKEAKIDLIRRALSDFNWERAFSNTNVNEKGCILNKSVLIVLSNFVPHETILCDDKDPPWFNSRIKSLLQAKNKVFNNYRNNKTNIQLLNKLNFLQERLNGLKTKLNNNYYKRMTNKLNNLQINSKAYWSLLKCF